MDVAQIRELVELMKSNELTELKIVSEDSTILLRRGEPAGRQPQIIAPMAPSPAAGAAVSEAEPSAETNNFAEITSPMVGTVYSAPSPTSPDFVKTGDHVDSGAVVCIIEAMKVMNEVKSEISGVIRKVLVENGQAVEFGQPLFLVEPD